MRQNDMDWDDLRYFMAVARAGSVRGAAGILRVNNATVSRRIRQFEAHLGARLFDRLPGGYAITATGEAVLATAERIEEEVQGVERRVLGQDARLSGDIKFTATHGFILKLLMPDLAVFMRHYPDVTLEIDMSYQTVDISAREADVALRLTKRPPEHLIGRKVAQFAKAGYATPAYLAAHDLSAEPPTARWIGWNDYVSHPEWVQRGPLPDIPICGRIASDMSQLAAAKQNVGMAWLPCFIGDTDPDLVRVPPGLAMPAQELWLLTHKDLLTTARIRIFWDFLLDALKKHKVILEGMRPRG